MMGSSQNIKCLPKEDQVRRHSPSVWSFPSLWNETKTNPPQKHPWRIARVPSAEDLGTVPCVKITLIRGILLGIRPILGIHSVFLMISCCLLVNDSKLIDSWDLWLTIFNNWIMSLRLQLHDSCRGRSSSQKARLNMTGRNNCALQVPYVVPYKALKNFSKDLYGTTGGTCSARFFRPVMIKTI